MNEILIQLAGVFSQLSVLGFGGGNALLPEMQQQVVGTYHWLSATDFSNLFALAQAAPGPNLMFVPLVGKAIAGWPGLLVVFFSFFVPSSLLVMVAIGGWNRVRGTSTALWVQRSLLPITGGLVAASAGVVAVTADRNLILTAITLASAFLAIRTNWNPLVLLAAGAALNIALGALGWAG